MSDDGPDTRRAVLALLCVFGLVAAAAAAPALADQTPLGGLDSPRAPAEVPDVLRNVDALDWLFGQQQSSSARGARNVFGALELSESASVGGPISQSERRQAAATHFVGTAAERRYWRTGAYVEYTGQGWQDSGDVHAFDGFDRDPATETTEHRVVLKRPATALPLVWRPASFDPDCDSGEGVCDVGYFQTEMGGLTSSSALGEGAAYRVTSQQVPSAEAVQEGAADAAGPQMSADTVLEPSGGVDDRYTEASTTSRVRSLTDRIVADGASRYETAAAVERYLESEKTYSLSDVPEPGDSVVDQFLFEQEKGYCEYFASAMAVMLRTQDVPARYVVGYAGGERVGDDRWVVRGADAHAWVEVYFEDVGWVRFDPTPAAPRQAADDRLGGSSAYSVSLNRTATPGERVTATVTAAGAPATGVVVSVNGERVGVTDADGEVAFTVPYAEELDVTVRPQGEARPSGASVVPDGGFAASVPPPSFAEQASNNTTEQTFPVNADVSVQFDGDVEPGTVVTMQVFVGDRAFPGARIRVDSDPVGRTGEDGHIRVRIPEDASGVLELTASRDELRETETYPVDGLTAWVSPAFLVPVPWTDATAHVTSGGEAVTDAVVTVDGEVVGRTDANGTVSFEMPASRVPEVVASSNGKTAVTYVDGVLPTLAVAAVAALAALGGVVVAVRRSGVTADGVVTTLTRAANEAVSLAVRAVVGVADALADLGGEFRAATGDGWRGVLEWARSLPGRVSVPNVSAWVAAVLAAVRGDEAAGSEASRASHAAGTSDRGETRLQAVWQRFVRAVGVERWETKTPAEVADRAVRSGFPERPVYALARAFRAAAYGDHSEAEGADRAQQALDELDGGDDQ